MGASQTPLKMMNFKQVLLWLSASAAIGAIFAIILRPGLIEVLVAWAVLSGVIVFVLNSKKRKNRV